MSVSHNLDVNSYNLEELFQLLNLPLNPSKEEMLVAKRRVLMFHPDKSNLPNEYFLFYKKAFDIALKYYDEQNKQNREITPQNTTYIPSQDEEETERIKKTISKMSGGNFSQNFNEIFEKNMVDKKEYKNTWFQEDKPTIEIPKSKDISQAFQEMKKNTHSLIAYKGVQDYTYSAGNQFYDDDDENENDYISSDPFSKLKFEDLRKVHKDQTIFSVSENDFNNVKQYNSVDHYKRERDIPVMTIEKKEAELLLAQKEKMRENQYLQNMHRANLNTMKYEEKNKSALSSFLQLK